MRIVYCILIFCIKIVYVSSKCSSFEMIYLIVIIGACHSVYYPATKCLDKLDHYECICGQGQLWNGYSCVGKRMKIENQSFTIHFSADSVDSRLIFNGSHGPSYIKLDSKTFPRISELTISFWLRIWPKIGSSQHTILFYKTGF